jgi:hypothetical protein
MKIIFVPRTQEFIEKNKNVEKKIPQLKEMQESWGKNYQVLTLDLNGEFNLTDGDQVYVLGGHGKPGSGVVFWGDEKNEKNWLPAETVAERTAKKWPALYLPRPVTANIGNKPSKERIPGVSIKIYSCHSGEGGYNSFANRFARAFRPVGATYEVTIFGYRGAISPHPQELTEGNITFSNDIELGRKTFPKTIPEGYTGPKESVVKGAVHRWSKINPWMYQSRTSEAREKVAWLKAEKGNVWQR